MFIKFAADLIETRNTSNHINHQLCISTLKTNLQACQAVANKNNCNKE